MGPEARDRTPSFRTRAENSFKKLRSDANILRYYISQWLPNRSIPRSALTAALIPLTAAVAGVALEELNPLLVFAQGSQQGSQDGCVQRGPDTYYCDDKGCVDVRFYVGGNPCVPGGQPRQEPTATPIPTAVPAVRSAEPTQTPIPELEVAASKSSGIDNIILTGGGCVLGLVILAIGGAAITLPSLRNRH